MIAVLTGISKGSGEMPEREVGSPQGDNVSATTLIPACFTPRAFFRPEFEQSSRTPDDTERGVAPARKKSDGPTLASQPADLTRGPHEPGNAIWSGQRPQYNRPGKPNVCARALLSACRRVLQRGTPRHGLPAPATQLLEATCTKQS
jgi:hypothetical protein